MKGYRVDIRLRQLAAIQISKYLWTQSDTKQSLKLRVKEDEDFLCHHSMELHDCYERNKKIFATILNKIDQLLIPEPAKHELVFAVGSMGSRILNFLEIMENEVSVPVHLKLHSIEHLCWTSNGCIDLPETTKIMYVMGKLPENFNTWLRLCDNCLEDCITDLWPKLSRAQFESPRFNYNCILSYYWDCRMRNNIDKVISHLRSFPNHINIYEAEHTIEENMFRVSAINCNYEAVKYFWSLLNDHQRERTITKLSENPIHYDPLMAKCKYVYFERGEHDADLIVFLLQQLSTYKIDDLLNMMLGSGFVIKKLLHWPWQDLFVETLEESWKHHKSIDYNPIIMEILYSMDKQYETIGTDLKYRKIFYEIWEKNPGNLKRSIDYSTVLHELWIMKDISLLKYIVNDKDLVVSRRNFLDYIITLSTKIPSDCDFLDRFIEQVLVCENERNSFKSLVGDAHI